MAGRMLGCIAVCLLATLSLADQEEEAEQLHCFNGDEGAPALEDCTSLLNDFANSQDGFNRIWDEEQLRRDGNENWGGMPEVGAQQLGNAVQLPRVFSRKSCNFLLTTFAGSIDIPPKPVETNWGLVNTRGNLLITKCLLNKMGKPAGGVVTVRAAGYPGAQSTNALSLWMWHNGGPWDRIFDSYMSYPARIIVTPYNDLKANLSEAVAMVPLAEVQPSGSETNLQGLGGNVVPISSE